MNGGPAGIKDQEEAALIARIVAGDARSYATLVDRYQQRLYWSCLRLLGDPDDAEDVVQETLVNAYQKLSSFDPAYRFYTWVYAIARNRCLNLLRKKRVWSTVSLSDETHAPNLAAAGSPRDEVENRELAQALADCRQALAADHRECFDLRHADGFSYREIAAAVGIPEGTVMSRLSRAREKMRECLRSKGVVWE